jgi:hypothetical protein
MAPPALSQEILIDLMRSAWLVEAARAEVYGSWAAEAERFEAARERALRRATIIEESLVSLARKPDTELVRAHADWMRSVGGTPPQDPFAELFLVRLGDWAGAHIAPYLDHGAQEVGHLSAQDHSEVHFPEQIPRPPQFAPLSGPPPPPPDTRFRVAVLADLHLGSRWGEQAARAAVEDVNSSGAGLCLQLGDLSENGEDSELELAAAVLAGLDMPWHCAVGNHDVFSRSEEALTDHFAATFGRQPRGALFEHEDLHFCLLDSAEATLSPFSSFSLVTGEFVEGTSSIERGSLSPEQHELLAEVAFPGAPPAFVFLHHPPQPFVSFPPVIFGLRDLDSGRLHATCDSGNVWGVFCGHTHRNARPRDFDGVFVTEVATPGAYPFGYGLIDVLPDGYSYSFAQLSDTDLVAEMYAHSIVLAHRYALGPPEARHFEWRAPALGRR